MLLEAAAKRGHPRLAHVVERRTRRHDVYTRRCQATAMCAHSSKKPFWRSPRAPPSPQQVSNLVPAAASASAPAPTGGECDTVGVTASKDETLVDKSSNTNVATKAAVGDEDKSKHEVSTHTTAFRNGGALRVRLEPL